MFRVSHIWIPLCCFLNGVVVHGSSDICHDNQTFGLNCRLQCHCNAGCRADGRCISGSCTELWYGPTCQIRLENVAFGKTASQGLKTKGVHNASLAVDGNINQQTNWSWARSDEGTVWWSVDFGSAKIILNLTVLFRYLEPTHEDYNQLEKRTRGYSIWISNETDPLANKRLQCYHSESSRHVISVTHCSEPARYVRVYNSRNGSLDKEIYSKLPNLQITEVIAHGDVGCASGSYGPKCDQECGHCYTDGCSRTAGTCSACLSGWAVDTCREGIQSCDTGKFGDSCQLACHCQGDESCQPNGICVKCDDGWAGPTCQIILENIALGKNASQGPTTKDVAIANYAVDGITDHNSSYAWAQNSTGYTYWSVDLGGVHEIFSITVWFNNPEPENKAVLKRRAGYSIRVASSSSTHIQNGNLCYQDNTNGAPPAVVTFTNCTFWGSHVVLFNKRSTPSNDPSYWSSWPNLELTEVQVFEDKGCSNGTYGEKCDQQCTCASESCDRINGCPIICDNCINPDNEAEGCKAGWFSDKCLLPCPGNCNSSECEKGTGQCTSSCKEGSYGIFCNETCPGNCEPFKCDQGTGECATSCKGGFYGNFCKQTCPVRCFEGKCMNDGSCVACNNTLFHGIQCDKECNQNCIGGCFQINGTCKSGCQDKFFGNMCDQPCNNCKIGCQRTGTCKTGGCVSGYYEDMCGAACDAACVDGCDQATGKCTKCEVGQYGDLCETSCSYCKNGKCERNGFCKTGCANSSYYGDLCEDECADNIQKCLECSTTTEGIVICSKCDSATYGADCLSPCPSHCESCSSLSACTKCKTGYTGETCQDICQVDNCLECDTGTGNCKKCTAGLYGDKCESVCPDRCATCVSGILDPANPVCKKCQKGSFLQLGSCDECLGTCTACTSVKNCTECNHGFYGSRCRDKCPTICIECSSESNCSNCSVGWNGQKCQCSDNCIKDVDIADWCADDGKCLRGCVVGSFGNACQNNCLPGCHQCDKDSGKCEKCESGFYGFECERKCGNCLPDNSGQVTCEITEGTCSGDCVAGYYGTLCNKSCSANCDNTGCDKTSGECHACKDGYFGSTCDQECGENCLSKSGQKQCGKITGKCDECVAMYYGERCNMACSEHCEADCNQTSGVCDSCKSNHFGPHCNNTCPVNCGPDLMIGSSKIVCNRFNGECIFCKTGFHGEICDKTCSQTCAASPLMGNKPDCLKSNGNCNKCLHGRYGDICELNCSENCGNYAGTSGKGSCNQKTGHCEMRCAPGWYNSTCTLKCSSTCKEERCDQYTAECLQGCVQSYEGLFCKDRLPAEDAGTSVIIGVVVTVVILIIVAIVVFVIIRRRRSGLTGRKSNGYSRGEIGLNNLDGVSAEENPLLYANANGNTGVNHLPVPARNNKASIPADDDLLDNDENSPLMSSKNTDPSDYYNLSSLIPVAGFAEYIQNRKMEAVDWYKDDFAKLPKGLLKSCHIASSLPNRGKCRYKQLYPYDESRVKLDPDGDAKSDFINASYVGGYKHPQAFIAAQGPTDVNLNDFWRMIWQKDCGKIVMLTNLFEECKMKCVRYWPEPDESQTYGRYEVVMVTENIFPDYTVRDLQATHIGTKEVKDFKHFHFTAWPDRGVPDNPSCMLHFREKVSEDESLLDGPMLVHCSAGIGRTGTFIALDYLLKQAHAESHIDVFRTITDMRYQRTNFIQTDVQYEFLHHAIAEALTTNEMEVSAANFCQHYWSLLNINPETGKTKLQEQFEILHQMSPVLDESCFSSGRTEDNVNKNRYPEIIPVDMYRAYLSTPVKGSNEYVNAVFLPTCSSKTAFLLTQMPLPHTVTDFWRLVYDQRATNIVMMNNVDDNDETIGEYWPSDDSTYGPFKVQLLSCENNDEYSTMSIRLTHSSLSKQTTMSLKLFRFEGWQEHESLPPSTSALTTLIGAVSRSPKENIDEPTIVHCMDGAERSGLYCVVAAILERLQTDQKVNIPQIILQLRSRRPQLIPTLEQFDFCHRAVTDYMEATQIYSNVI